MKPIDLASADKWDAYTEARDEMFCRTDTDEAPWTVILSDDKKRARINSMLNLLNCLNYEHKDKKIAHAPDPRVVGRAKDLFPHLN